MKRKKPKAQDVKDHEKWLLSLERLDPKFARTPAPTPSKILQYSLSSPRKTAEIRSLTTSGASTALRTTLKYTGNKVLGLGTLHKSNSVPIFSVDEAQEIARMRR